MDITRQRDRAIMRPLTRSHRDFGLPLLDTVYTYEIYCKMNRPKQPASDSVAARPMTVRVTANVGRFQFNNTAACWLASHAITRISIELDPVLKAVSVVPALPDSKSLALAYRYLPKQTTPVHTSFYSKQILQKLQYKAENATFLCIPRQNGLTFLLDPEYKLSPIQVVSPSDNDPVI